MISTPEYWKETGVTRKLSLKTQRLLFYHQVYTKNSVFFPYSVWEKLIPVTISRTPGFKLQDLFFNANSYIEGQNNRKTPPRGLHKTGPTALSLMLRR